VKTTARAIFSAGVRLADSQLGEMLMLRKSLLFCAALACLTSTIETASAVPSFGTVSPTKANGDFIAGTGIKSNNFTIDTAPFGESVALKARDRSTGDPLAQVGNVYTVSPGNNPANRTAWNFDFQFSPGDSVPRLPSDYTYTLLVDTNPLPGVATFTTITVPPSNATPAAPAGDSFFANPGGGAWSSNTTPFVIANSENYAFGFLAGSGFTNPEGGEYQIDFIARDAVTGGVVASTTIFATVAPEPGSLSLLGLAASALLARRRRTA
jgi:hypothetical protein